MNTLILKQEDVLERVSRAFINYKKSPKERITILYIEARVEQLEKLNEAFESCHCELVDMESKLEGSYFTEELCNRFEETYLEYNTKMREDLRKLQSRRDTSSTNTSTNLFRPILVNIINVMLIV